MDKAEFRLFLGHHNSVLLALQNIAVACSCSICAMVKSGYKGEWSSNHYQEILFMAIARTIRIYKVNDHPLGVSTPATFPHNASIHPPDSRCGMMV